MTVTEVLRSGLLYLDGGMGSILQKMGLPAGEAPELWSLSHPDRVTQIHRAYYEAGSHVVYANTFGISALRYTCADGYPSAETLVRAAMDCAAEARRTAVGGAAHRFIALDVGPVGRLTEPFGDMPFDEAVGLFARVIRAGAAAGADLVAIETVNDMWEARAALLAAKECCRLPVFVTCVFDSRGKTLTGSSPQEMAIALEAMGANAVGMNCSLGPRQMLELLPQFTAVSSLPVIAKPNAGMPRLTAAGGAEYDIDAREFAHIMRELAAAGARILGGCCGTEPEYIRAMTAATADIVPSFAEAKRRTLICSYGRTVEIGKAPVLVGERINPSGRKNMQAALRRGEIGCVLEEGLAQAEAGAHMLDVNAGMTDIDEAETLAQCVKQLQSVCDLPLQIDTADVGALEKALRIYGGKAVINSVSGKRESMDAVFPLAKKYGGAVICMTMDEDGIPDTAEGRLAIAEKMARRAEEYGIGLHDLIFDSLALSAASSRSSAATALETVRLIRERLGARCILGISNISYGLPHRGSLNAAFLTMALAGGLDAAIVNPLSQEIRQAYRAYMALSGRDAHCAEYIAAFGGESRDMTEDGLRGAIARGLREAAETEAARELERRAPMDIVNGDIIPALSDVGDRYGRQEIFLPQLLMSAEAASAALAVIKRELPAAESRGPAVVLATVRGDVHDIGKNIAKAVLESCGCRVVDMGKNVLPEEIVRAVRDSGARLAGLSALMTTTLPAMAETAALLKKSCPDCRIMVGGAVLTEEYARGIGADFYASDAMAGARYALSLLAEDC